MVEQIKVALAAHRVGLANRLKSIDSEYEPKGLFRSGPRIRAVQTAMSEHFMDVAQRLLALAKVQPNPDAADVQVLTALEAEHSNLRDRLRQVVDSTGDSDAARRAADDLMDQLWQEVESLGSIPRVARRGGQLDINEAVSLSDVGEAELIPAASRWTGIPSRSERLVALRGQLEIAQSAVGYLVNDLADTDGNRGPLLDEHNDALEALRELHHVLGELLVAIDRGTLDDELGEGFVAEIVRYGSRATEALRDDPARFVLSATIYAVLSACGLGDLGGFLAGAAASIKRAQPRKE